MKTIGIITNNEKDEGLKVTALLVQYIEKWGGKPLPENGIGERLGLSGGPWEEDALLSQSDVIICLGGDGTFLNAARRVYRKGIPLLGINLGRLGFLAEVDRNQIENAVENIINGNYSIEQRMMIEADVIRGGKVIGSNTALNDVFISRGALSRILHVKTYINDTFVDTFPGDGLIIASPTGSTAYSLSAGGPIVEPDIDLMIITPVCPHILYSRSFITTGSRSVKAVIDENFQHTATVAFDGQEVIEVRGGDSVVVRKSSYNIKMIRMNPRNFFDVLRNKIYYRGESLKNNEI